LLSTGDAANTADKEGRASLEPSANPGMRCETGARSELLQPKSSNNLGKDVTSITSVLEVISGIAEQKTIAGTDARNRGARHATRRGFACGGRSEKHGPKTKTSHQEITAVI